MSEPCFEDRKRSELKCAALKLAAAHLETGSHGNISSRRDSSSFLIKPSGKCYQDVWDEDFVEVSFDPYSRSCLWPYLGPRPSVDTHEHAEIYDRHPWVKAIVHTHSTYATVFAMWGGDIQVYSTEHADFFGQRIRCAIDGMIGWGEKIDLVEGERAVLLGQHGALVVSEKGPEHAAKLAIALEEVAKKTFLLYQMPRIRPISPLANDVVDAFHSRYNGEYGQR
jgi:L-ribulose-5-phosphate 4-epimerase